PRAPLAEDLGARLWLKANRSGMQLLARLVLPHERNPKNLDEPLSVLLRGEIYQTVSRWQPLQVRNPLKQARERLQLLRAELQRDVNMADAYVDRLVLNLYAGPGQTEVWIDDLEIGPVVESNPPQGDAPTPGTSTPGTPTGRPVPRRPVVV